MATCIEGFLELDCRTGSRGLAPSFQHQRWENVCQVAKVTSGVLPVHKLMYALVNSVTFVHVTEARLGTTPPRREV